MRICLISREYPPDTGFGGIATFTSHLAQGLKACGHHVEVVSLAKGKAGTFSSDGILVHRVDNSKTLDSYGLANFYIPYSLYSIACASAMWEKFLELHRADPFDVVDTPELLAEGLGPAITRAVPLLIRLYTPHSKFIAERFHNVTPSFDHQLIAMLERVAMLNADTITSPSDDLAAFVASDLNYPLERIAIVRNPIDTNVFSPYGEKAVADDGRPIVMFVGRLEGRKGIKYLIDAVPDVVRKVGDVRFIVIGDDTNTDTGQTSVLASLKATLKENNCQQHVEFIDRVLLEQLPAYYRSADVSIVPSLYDNSPYTCLEAMACGNAVIGTSAGGTAEYMVHNESGLIISPKDSQAIASALCELLTDHEKRKSLGENARARAIDRFDRTVIARETVSLYESAIESFKCRQQNNLYLKPADDFLADSQTMLKSFDKMLYDELWRASYRFRLRRLCEQIVLRPRLTFAKLVLRVSKLLVKIVTLGSRRPMPEFISSLEREVETRSKDSSERELVKR